MVTTRITNCDRSPGLCRLSPQSARSDRALVAQHKSLLAIDLMNELAYQGTSTHTFANWRTRLRQKYGSIDRVNDAWGTEFAGFDAIDSFPTQPDARKDEWQRKRIDWNKPGTRGMHFDWCAFNKHRVTQYFGDANERVWQHAPRVSTHVKAMLSNYFSGSTEQRGWPMRTSYNTFGIDIEAINRMCGINGGDDSFRDLSATPTPNRYFGNSPYVAGWLNSGMVTDLLKSVSPNHPNYNSEFHAVEEIDSEENEPIPAEHMKLAYLINLMRTPVTVKLHWTPDDAKFRDIDSGQALSNSITLQPREIVIGAY